MRNKLLALMALCGATSSTMPLWAAWDDPELDFVNPNLTENVEGGGVYYVYHVATQKFMVEGNYKADWGTELVVGDEGKKITLSWGQDYELSRRPQTDVEYNAAFGWRMSMKEGKTNSQLHELYIPAGLQLCVDHNNQGHMLWKIVKQSDKTYRIKISDSDPMYGATSEYANDYIGVIEGESGVTPLIRDGAAGVGNPGYDWKFVAPDVYDVYQAKKKLKVQLEAADAAGYKDYTAYADLYNDANAKVEALEEATVNLKSEILDFKYNSATELQPMDVTDLISQPSFKESTDGWVTKREGTTGNFVRKTGDKMVASDGTECEAFFEYWIPSSSGNQPNWSILQDLKDLPDGKYRLGAYIMTNNVNEVPKGRFLYAKTLVGEARTEANVQAVENPGKANGYFAPYTVEFSVIGGTATIGMVVENANSNWTAVDNFTLKYLGKSGAVTYRTLLENNIKSAEEKYKEYVDANETFSNMGQQKYEETIRVAKEAAANESVGDEELKGLITTVQLRMDSLAMDIAAYKKLGVKIEELNNAYAESYEEVGLIDYEKFLDDLDAAKQGKTFDPSEIDSIDVYSERALRAAVVKSLSEEGGTREVTGLFVNPNFDNALTGWTKGGANTGDFKAGHAAAELWNAKGGEVVVYQDLEGLPKGSYKVTMQGYYCPSSQNKNSWKENWGQEGDTSNDIHGYLVANDAAVKLHHPMDRPISEAEKEGLAGNFEAITWDDSMAGMYWTRSLEAASSMMSADPTFQLNETTCYVGEDGKLRIGIKLDGKNIDWDASWVVMDNFQVTYLGADDMSGAESALNALIAEAVGMRDREALTTAESKETLNKAITGANEAVSDGLTLEEYVAQVEVLNEAITAAGKAEEAASKFEALVVYHDNKFRATDENSYTELYGDTEEFDAFEGVIVEMLDKVEVLESMAQIEQYTAQITEAYSKMVAAVLDVSKASLQTPADVTSMIQTPNFSEWDAEGAKDVASIQGWVVTNGISNATSGLNYEFYEKENADIHQTIYGLPKGYYRLSFNGFYRAGNSLTAALAHRDGTEEINGSVYVKAGEGQWEETLHSIFDDMAEFKYDAEDVVLADSLFPGSNALYNIIVNNVAGTKLAFEDGKYESDFSFYVSESGQPVVLGAHKEKMIPADWMIFDNFKLLYYGDGDANKPDDFVSSVEETVADGKATVVSSAWYTINGVRVAEPKQRGIYIRQDKMSDGTTRSLKVMVR